MENKQRFKRQSERWEKWRQSDFDRLLQDYTRVTHDFALSSFTMRPVEDINELAQDSSFLLEQLRMRFYQRQEDRFRPQIT